MAGIGHVAIGMAAARVESGRARRPAWRDLAFWSVLALLPDVDFVTMAFGVPLDATWGHRGVSHSLLVAAVMTGAIAWTARGARRSPWWIAGVAALVGLTHPMLDSMTGTGYGCSLWWPFDTTRYFMPWTPLPSISTFPELHSVVALQVAGLEAIVFAPFLLFAFWPERAVTKAADRTLPPPQPRSASDTRPSPIGPP